MPRKTSGRRGIFRGSRPYSGTVGKGRGRHERKKGIGTSQTFTDDFESGSLTTNWPTRAGGVSASTNAPHAGTYGARIAPNSGTAHLASSTSKWTQSFYRWGLVKFWLRLNDLAASGTTDIVFIQNTLQTNNFDLFVNTDGDFRVNLTHGVTLLDLEEAVLDEWYYVQCKVGYMNPYRCQVKLNNKVHDWLFDSGETASFVRSLHFGITTSTTYSFDIDDVHMLVSEREPSFDAVPS